MHYNLLYAPCLALVAEPCNAIQCVIMRYKSLSEKCPDHQWISDFPRFADGGAQGSNIRNIVPYASKLTLGS